jgi:hypothetical protein
MELLHAIFNRPGVKAYRAEANEPAIKAELHIPEDMRAVVPMALGWPASVPSPIAPTAPRILSWRRESRATASGRRRTFEPRTPAPTDFDDARNE